MLDSNVFAATEGLSREDLAYLVGYMESFWDRPANEIGPFELEIVIPASARKQIDEAPEDIRKFARSFIHTTTTPFDDTFDEQSVRSAVRESLRGNSQTGKHDDDADILFEVQKYRFDVLVSNDKRVRKLGAEVVGKPVLTAGEMMAAIRSNEWPREEF